MNRKNLILHLKMVLPTQCICVVHSEWAQVLGVAADRRWMATGGFIPGGSEEAPQVSKWGRDRREVLWLQGSLLN